LRLLVQSGFLTSKPAPQRLSTSKSIIRWATNWIICLSRSASAPFSTNSVNAMVGLVIVVSLVSVWSSQTQRKPRTTMTILFRPQGAFGWFSYTTPRDTITSSVRYAAVPRDLVSSQCSISYVECLIRRFSNTRMGNTTKATPISCDSFKRSLKKIMPSKTAVIGEDSSNTDA